MIKIASFWEFLALRMSAHMQYGSLEKEHVGLVSQDPRFSVLYDILAGLRVRKQWF